VAVVDGSLPAARVAEAVGRVHAMADALTDARAAHPLPEVVGPVHLEDEWIKGTFDHGRRAIDWRLRAADGFTVVRLEDRPNIAVGVVPWGPDLADHAEVVVHPGDVVDPAVLEPGPVLVLGRDIHRHPDARATVDRLRATRDVLVVDLGWPSRDRPYADIATYGASRRVGRALRSWIEEG
jgi:beta-N-acetylhexosaminidase